MRTLHGVTPPVMKTTARFDARAVRDVLLKRGGPNEAGFIRFAYRPFDNRWLYWEAETKLLDEKRADYQPHRVERSLYCVFDHRRRLPWEAETKLLDEKRADYQPHVVEENLCLVFQKKARPDPSPPLLISSLGDRNQMNSGVYRIPAFLRYNTLQINDNEKLYRSNLSDLAQSYLDNVGLNITDLFHHMIAVLYEPTYNESNADALRAEGPRIPLPGWPKGDAEGAAAALAHSAARGRQLAALLDPDVPLAMFPFMGLTQALFRPEMDVIAVPTTTDGRNMTDEDFAVTAGWGHFGKGDAVMPGQGRVVERPFTSEERSAMSGHHGTIDPVGDTTLDVYLNDRAFWRNVPFPVWRYKLGGYQVLKKWLSYRERGVLGRALRDEEVLYFAEVGRRIWGILTLQVGGWKNERESKLRTQMPDLGYIGSLKFSVMMRIVAASFMTLHVQAANF